MSQLQTKSVPGNASFLQDGVAQGGFAQLHELLQSGAQLLSDLPEAAPWRADLVSLQQRLQHAQRLVAVFGAFSAGKSSLLNALLGEPLLAVSPNPTTATVTQLRAAAQATVQVTFKTFAQLWQDVREACHQAHHEAASLEAALAFGRSLSITDLPVPARRAGAFVRAAAAGYDDVRDGLGETLAVEREQLRTFTADEQVACFVQAVDIGHPAPFLQEGLVMVDTPGVNSIHRRHTQTSFAYMRKADAVVFVLYYTHAFSRVDKDFLLQLSGVQDVAKMDKLFVAINAVDLAVSDEERAAVRERVVSELGQVGISRPRVFEVSSQLALAAQQLAVHPGDPQFAQLVRQRMRLDSDTALPSPEQLLAYSGVLALADTLREVSSGNRLQLATATVHRTLNAVATQVYAHWLVVCQARESDSASRQAAQTARAALREELGVRGQQLLAGASEVERGLLAGWTELAFHAGERVRLRLGDLFRESFHPGRLRDDRQSRAALTAAAQEFAQTLTRQVELEHRTFTMRVEQQLQAAVDRWRDQLQTQLNTASGGAEAIGGAAGDAVELPAGDVLPEVYGAEFEGSFRHFKSARQFFEGGGQQAMRTDVESTAAAAVQRELGQAVQATQSSAVECWRAAACAVLDEAVRVLSAAPADPTRVTPQQVEAWERAQAWFARWH